MAPTIKAQIEQWFSEERRGAARARDIVGAGIGKDAGVRLKRVAFENDGKSAHTHVSVAECDSDAPLNANYDLGGASGTQ